MNFSVILSCLFAIVAPVQESNVVNVYFGTGGSNSGQPAGVYTAELDQAGVDLKRPKLLHELKGAGWVTTHPTKPILYSTGSIKGEASAVSIRLDASENESPLMNSQSIGDGGSCFLTTDHTGTMLISAQYGGGSVAVFPIESDGALGPQTQLIEHQGGSKVVKNRQNSPHPHYVAISPDNRFAFVPDLGLDQLVAYKIDLENRKLIPNGSINVVKGGGPRHMKFHPNGKFAFVLNELKLAVSVFMYETETGNMTLVDTVPALTEEEKSLQDFNSSSEIRIHPNGELVFSANRGHDSISIFKFDASHGELKRTQVAPIHGAFPRNFNISPDGKLLLAAGANSNSISLFHVKLEGKLKHVLRGAEFVPGPICVTFAPSKSE